MLEDEDLFKRYGALKYFLEFNWGRIGLKLQRVRKAKDVSAAIKLVPRFEQFIAFRDYNALCFSDDGTGPVRFLAVRKIKRWHEEAKDTVSSRWSEFHNSSQKPASAQDSLKIAVSEFSALALCFSVFNCLFKIAFEVLRIRAEFESVQQKLRDAQTLEENLRKKRAAHEAWFAQNEIVQLRRSKRHELNADNLAKAMAGMPDYGWFNSFRRCEKLDIESFTPRLRLGPSPYPYQVFEIVTRITKRMKPLKLERIEKRLLKELRLDENTILRETVKPHWLHMKQAFDDCRGQRFTRRTFPYLLIGRFVDRLESSKSALDLQVAPLAEAELTVGRENK